MRHSFTLKSIFVLISGYFLLSSCEDLGVKYITLDNQSDYTVTVELYTGNDDNQGYMIYEPYSVSSHSTKKIESQTTWVYVDTYRPSDLTDMELNGSKIIFTNIP